MTSGTVTKRKNKESPRKTQPKIAASETPKAVDDDNNAKPKEPRFGKLPKFPHQRVWSRGVMIIGIIIYVWFFSAAGKETSFAVQKDVHEHRSQTRDCDKDFAKDIAAFTGCIPQKCGRFLTDKLITATEADALLKMAMKGISLGGSDGGASILDLHSGALSYGQKFINVYSLTDRSRDKVFTSADLLVYKIVREKIQETIATIFNLDGTKLYLTHPTFFSKLTSAEPKTAHDEYWHPHVDKVTYESFHYTALLYLSDFGVDFTGGRFVWQDYPPGKDATNTNSAPTNVTMEPRRGRVVIFTSGAENLHFVERVKTGTRYAITVSFTCDVSKSIGDITVK